MWRLSAFDIQEKSGRRAKFPDMVSFIKRQAKVAADPVFGDIRLLKIRENPDANVRMTRATRPNGSSSSFHISNAFQKPCAHCGKQHTLAGCHKIRNQPYKERLEFIKGQGLCFGLLT